MLIVRATRSLLDPMGPPSQVEDEQSILLGQWHTTALFWKPQVALFANERVVGIMNEFTHPQNPEWRS